MVSGSVTEESVIQRQNKRAWNLYRRGKSGAENALASRHGCAQILIQPIELRRGCWEIARQSAEAAEMGELPLRFLRRFLV
jgi:hypothetical protein